MKKKLVRTNQAPNMTKALRKAYMRSQELKSKFFRVKTNDTLKAQKYRKTNAADFTKKGKTYLKI